MKSDNNPVATTSFTYIIALKMPKLVLENWSMYIQYKNK